MLAERPRLLMLAVAWGLFAHNSSLAANDELPDIEFLDYLGSWEESDEDWQVVIDANRVHEPERNDERSDPALASEESTETENEQ